MASLRWLNNIVLHVQHRKDVCMLFGGILLGFSLSVVFSLVVVTQWFYVHAPDGKIIKPAFDYDDVGACVCGRVSSVDNALAKTGVADNEVDGDAFTCDVLDIRKKLRQNMAKVQADMREQVSVRSSLLREITEHKQQLENLRHHVAQLEFRLRAVWLSVRVNERERKRFADAASSSTSALRRLQDHCMSRNNHTIRNEIPAKSDTRVPIKLTGRLSHSPLCVTPGCFSIASASCSTYPWKMSFSVSIPKSCGDLVTLAKHFVLHQDYYAGTNTSDDPCYAIAFQCDDTNDVERASYPTKAKQIISVFVDEKVARKRTQSLAVVFRPAQTRFASDILMPVFIPSLFTPSSVISLLSPARRRYLMTFEACSVNTNSKNSLVDFLYKLLIFLGDERKHLSDILINIKYADTSEAFKGELDLPVCEPDESRQLVLNSSTFVLIPVFLPSTKLNFTASELNFTFVPSFTLRFFEALKFGAVPVLLVDHDDAEYVRDVLPLGHFIDWSRAAVIVSWPQFFHTSSRLLDVFTYSMGDEEIFRLRLQGRRIFDTYVSSPQQYVHTLLAALRRKLKFYPPAVPADFLSAGSIAYRDDGGNNIGNFSQLPFVWDEVVGPIEAPYASPQFQSNISAALINSYAMWNDHFAPFYMYPHTPYDTTVPLAAETRFLSPSMSVTAQQNSYFRPLGDMSNSDGAAAGAEMAHELGGDAPYEQYTIVMLTYRREQVLVESLQRLHQLPYLNKVIVVWNDADVAPATEFPWPKLHVPLVVIKSARNSLNNRFLPYAEIETKAVLSIDDDVFMRPDELTLAFRVWRENRDRLVGFPARYQTRNDNEWLYNSNYTCEYSMILTGVAFLHKYYLYRYSDTMPQSIRDAVDELMNCEDIAMNFLVAHETHKPTLKVTSRWTFKCPGCGVDSLWQDSEHFLERKKCLNLFSSIYGYNPLRVSQLRADSVLYKTRTPLGKEKCFKYV